MNTIKYGLKAKTILLLLVCSAFVKLSFSQTLQPPVKQLSYNAPSDYHLPIADGEDWFYSIIQSSDGGYVGTGYAEYVITTGGVAVYNPSIVKLDHSGKKLWETVFPNTHNDVTKEEFGMDVIETPDCYAVVGPLYDFAYPNKTLCILKFNKTTGALIGTPIDLQYGGSNYGTIRKVTDAAGVHSGYIVSNPIGSPVTHTGIIKLKDDFSLDLSFNSTGFKTFSGSECRDASVVHNAIGNAIGYALVGTTRGASVIDGYGDGYLAYCDMNGLLINEWTITYQSLHNNINIPGGYTDVPNFQFWNLTPSETPTEFGANVENYVTPGGNYLIANFDFNILEYSGLTFDNAFTNQWLSGGYANSADPSHGGSLQNRDQALIKFDLNSTTHGSFPNYGDIVWATNPVQFSGVDFLDPLRIEPMVI